MNTVYDFLFKIGVVALIIIIILIGLSILLMVIGSKSAEKDAAGAEWTDTMRVGPFAFKWHRYMIKGERLIERSGVWKVRENEVYLYLVTDITLNRNIIQRIFGIGTIVLTTRDENERKVYLRVKDPKSISEKLSDTVVRYRRKRPEVVVR